MFLKRSILCSGFLARPSAISGRVTRNINNISSTFRYLSSIKSKENIYTIPNLLTASRLLITPMIYHTITTNQYTTSLALISIAGITDLLDGFIARRFKSSTVFGSVLDPFADKVLMTSLVLGCYNVSLLSAPTAVLILGRDIGLVIGMVIQRYNSITPKNLSTFFDMTYPTLVVSPPLISKINTACQLGLMVTCVSSQVVGFNYEIILGCEAIVWITTIWSGIIYLVKRNVLKRV